VIKSTNSGRPLPRVVQLKKTHPTGSSATPDPLSSAAFFTVAHAGTNSQAKHAASEHLPAPFTSRKHAVLNMRFLPLVSSDLRPP